ncbi:hypothetical protein MKX01_036394 [Papaver californicum]|nr:hypothetical protein MKX01_036394 [Papaver californicum]
MHNVLQSDFRSALPIAATTSLCYLNPSNSLGISYKESRRFTLPLYHHNLSSNSSSLRIRSLSSTSDASSPSSLNLSDIGGETQQRRENTRKPSTCTADELHYVSVPNTEWRLALWRYLPSPQAPPRNHPLLLLSGVGTNAIGFDLSPQMEYVTAQTKPKDGKLLAIGHSMRGILLYAMLAKYGSEGRNSSLAAIVTLASSLDYSASRSSLKLLLPLADPAQALNVPVIPLGALLAAAYPLSSRPPYVLSWLNHQISAEDMMHPELLKKLVLNNFCTIPAKLLLQLTTAFQEGGLRDRSGTFFYKDHLQNVNVPVLALAGDFDMICPPDAVYGKDTVKIIPQHLITYKVFGEDGGPHYAHYDLVGGCLELSISLSLSPSPTLSLSPAVEQVYPCIVEFLGVHDTV